MHRLSMTFLWNAITFTLLTIGTFFMTSKVFAYLHGMPAPRLSETDTYLSLLSTCIVAFLLPAMAYAVYTSRPADERLAATTPGLGNLMSTLFAVSAYFELTGMTLVFIGAAIGVAGAFVALRAGLEEKVGGTLMLCVVIAQIVLCTGLI